MHYFFSGLNYLRTIYFLFIYIEHLVLETCSSIVFDRFMNFEIKILKDQEPAISTTIAVPVSDEMSEDIKLIKKSSERNRRLVNESARQFFSQLIEKYKSGEFEVESA